MPETESRRRKARFDSPKADGNSSSDSEAEADSDVEQDWETKSEDRAFPHWAALSLKLAATEVIPTLDDCAQGVVGAAPIPPSVGARKARVEAYLDNRCRGMRIIPQDLTPATSGAGAALLMFYKVQEGSGPGVKAVATPTMTPGAHKLAADDELTVDTLLTFQQMSELADDPMAKDWLRSAIAAKEEPAQLLKQLRNPMSDKLRRASFASTGALTSAGDVAMGHDMKAVFKGMADAAATRLQQRCEWLTGKPARQLARRLMVGDLRSESLEKLVAGASFLSTAQSSRSETLSVQDKLDRSHTLLGAVGRAYVHLHPEDDMGAWEEVDQKFKDLSKHGTERPQLMDGWKALFQAMCVEITERHDRFRSGATDSRPELGGMVEETSSLFYKVHAEIVAAAKQRHSIREMVSKELAASKNGGGGSRTGGDRDQGRDRRRGDGREDRRYEDRDRDKRRPRDNGRSPNERDKRPLKDREWKEIHKDKRIGIIGARINKEYAADKSERKDLYCPWEMLSKCQRPKCTMKHDKPSGFDKEKWAAFLSSGPPT